MNSEKKQLLRSVLKDSLKRQALREISYSVCNFMLESKVWEPRSNVLFYWPLKYEIDLKRLIHNSIQHEKRCYLPKAYTKNGQLICAFSELKSLNQELYRGEFGNMECAGLGDEDFSKIDLVFVPALMFDKKGYRLGRGLGFYDRLIAKLSQNTTTIGVIPENLFVDEIDLLDKWDKPVKYVLTEKQLKEISPSK